MKNIKFALISLITAIGLIFGSAIVKRVIAVGLCGVLGASSPACYTLGLSRVMAQTPDNIAQVDIFSNPNSGNNQTSNNNCSLTGRWIEYIDGKIDEDVSGILEITQTGNSLQINPSNQTGTIFHNTIQFSDTQYRASFTAIINSDCNEINMGNWSDTNAPYILKRYTVPYCPLTGQWQYTQYKPTDLEPIETHTQRRFSEPILSTQIEITEDANGNVTIAGIPNTNGVATTKRNSTLIDYINLPLKSDKGFLNGQISADESKIIGYLFTGGEPYSGEGVNKGSYKMVRLNPCPSNNSSDSTNQPDINNNPTNNNNLGNIDIFDNPNIANNNQGGTDIFRNDGGNNPSNSDVDSDVDIFSNPNPNNNQNQLINPVNANSQINNNALDGIWIYSLYDSLSSNVPIQSSLIKIISSDNGYHLQPCDDNCSQFHQQTRRNITTVPQQGNSTTEIYGKITVTTTIDTNNQFIWGNISEQDSGEILYFTIEKQIISGIKSHTKESLFNHGNINKITPKILIADSRVSPVNPSDPTNPNPYRQPGQKPDNNDDDDHGDDDDEPKNPPISIPCRVDTYEPAQDPPPKIGWDKIVVYGLGAIALVGIFIALPEIVTGAVAICARIPQLCAAIPVALASLSRNPAYGQTCQPQAPVITTPPNTQESQDCLPCTIRNVGSNGIRHDERSCPSDQYIGYFKNALNTGNNYIITECVCQNRNTRYCPLLPVNSPH